MLDLVQIKMILVISVGAGVGVQIVLQISLHPGVSRLRAQHILVRAGESGTAHAGQQALRKNGTGGHAVEQQAGAQQQPDNDSDTLLVLPEEAHAVFGFLRSLFRGLGGILHGGGGTLTGTDVSGVLLLDSPLVLPAGEGITGKLGILPDMLLVEDVYIGLFQPPIFYQLAVFRQSCNSDLVLCLSALLQALC